jgi:hypothetical protein
MNNYFLAKKSRYSLILPAFIPFYLIALYLFKTSLDSIFLVNIGFGIAVTLLYLGAWGRTMVGSNTLKQKQKSS